MDQKPPEIIRYQRGRFSAHLPADRLYTPSHFWLAQTEGGVWRVGFTEFALRMLGDLVEHGFSAKPGQAVELGQTIGWVEGFKTITDLPSVVAGEFVGGNPGIDQDITVIESDPYGTGWLYAVRGQPDAKAAHVKTYCNMLNSTIDRIKAGDASDSPKNGCN